ncbi:MAG: hypothetical protein JO202_06105 [Ktedonobacteraceae bacterium]|nr:hypothetical protein [Ktedonobacteraceae bacterium]
MFAFVRRGPIALMIAFCVSALVLMGMGYASGSAVPSGTSVLGLPGYTISVFAKGTKSYYNPDSAEVVGKYAYVGYQNSTAKDGSDKKSSTIVQYTLQGKVVHTFNVPGHCDGLRYDPYTHVLWATSNEDGNPGLVTIDPVTAVITPYQFSPTPHGGGYDDVAFLNNAAFIAASNPTLNSAGVNVFPAVDQITLSNGKAILTPVLKGNDTATDLVTGKKITLNLTDPDSLSIDSQGNLVQDSQADAELIFLHNPGTATQTVTRLSVGTQVDDSLWIPSSKGRLLVADSSGNTIYAVTLDKGFTRGTVYTEAPSDSGVASFVGTLDVKTGTITPVIIGLKSPTGLAFIPA